MKTILNRRDALKTTALLLGAGLTGNLAAKAKPRFQLGACDWSIGPRLNPGTFDIARKIGLQGLQVSYNTKDDEAGLSVSSTLQGIKDAAQRTGIMVSSLAIGELNRTPYKSEPRTEEWVWNSVDAAKALGVKVILLAFFGNGELRDDEAGQKMVIERLKKVAPHAEKQGVTLGVESYLSAREHLKIIDAVGSKAVKVYYDSRNSADAGHDIYEEIPFLGKDMICELHMKENGFRLGEGTVDWPRVATLLKKINYQGWMQIEGATPKGADPVETYQHNRRYLEKLFEFA
ncbi:sugar phosphate isomerase/epimerase family protein [Persicitalea jodogahamensis]|uniref:Putative L-ribulose-5-phosphate 3-epimerase SgbU n=1 Tax=Persicitalea jodogahamensis TaxID=402147 RepID=A0A8J3DAT2_9BACT|nr:sugar phosphate isomerase/epimerase family protein [Persicitalea jodogahamensis]GHB83549.1 putative L-ribulose-5-phosphate 3-epimerase SgbU [Persicitalea jodogahamensis]